MKLICVLLSAHQFVATVRCYGYFDGYVLSVFEQFDWFEPSFGSPG